MTSQIMGTEYLRRICSYAAMAYLQLHGSSQNAVEQVLRCTSSSKTDTVKKCVEKSTKGNVTIPAGELQDFWRNQIAEKLTEEVVKRSRWVSGPNELRVVKVLHHFLDCDVILKLVTEYDGNIQTYQAPTLINNRPDNHNVISLHVILTRSEVGPGPELSDFQYGFRLPSDEIDKPELAQILNKFVYDCVIQFEEKVNCYFDIATGVVEKKGKWADTGEKLLVGTGAAVTTLWGNPVIGGHGGKAVADLFGDKCKEANQKMAKKITALFPEFRRCCLWYRAILLDVFLELCMCHECQLTLIRLKCPSWDTTVTRLALETVDRAMDHLKRVLNDNLDMESFNRGSSEDCKTRLKTLLTEGVREGKPKNESLFLAVSQVSRPGFEIEIEDLGRVRSGDFFGKNRAFADRGTYRARVGGDISSTEILEAVEYRFRQAEASCGGSNRFELPFFVTVTRSASSGSISSSHSSNSSDTHPQTKRHHNGRQRRSNFLRRASSRFSKIFGSKRK